MSEQRMIDANALKAKAFGKRKGLIHTADIDAMPTIEERKTGKWIPFDDRFPWSQWYQCSECGAVRKNVAFMENYCPNCGARLVQEGEDNDS